VTAAGAGARIHPAAATGFEASAERYDRGRPSYPVEAVDALVAELDLGTGRHVVELGAGTGKFTVLLAPTGATITAVEPVRAMRTALERAVPTARAVDGTAEAIPVDDGGADAVVAAQAFHWFDAERALVEIRRVLRDAGRLGMIWNVRDERPAWSRRLTEIFDRLSGPGDPRYKHRAWRAAFERTDAFTPLEHRSFAYTHDVTREAFLDRVLSVSYVASAPRDVRDTVTREVEDLLDADPDLAGRQTIAMPYTTDVYWCERR
jgi:ubiquinone/menaquinone biosynthesis C-methylase UbiE